MLHVCGNVHLLYLGCVPTGLGPCIPTTQSHVTIWYYPELIINLGCCANGAVEDLLSSVLAQPITKSLSSLKSKLKPLSSTILKNKLYKASLNDLLGFFKFTFAYFLKSPHLVCIKPYFLLILGPFLLKFVVMFTPHCL